MQEVTIYTTRYCPYCNAAKAFMKRKGITFNEIDIAGNWERRDEMFERSNGQVNLPQIFIGGAHIGGRDDLEALERSGELGRLLK